MRSVSRLLAASLLASTALAADGPVLVGRATPRISLPGPSGCSSILLIAEIKGPETEAWYCPAIRWRWPDDTESFAESDCPPFEDREEFPRLWRKRICAPAHPNGDDWIVTVELSRNGRVFASQVIKFAVKGS